MLKLNYAVTPVSVNQPFGANPDYYARFHDAAGNPEKGHMGVDFMAAHGTPLYAPCDGDAYYQEDSHGGDGIYIRTTADDGKHYLVILWHMCSKDDPKYPILIPSDGSITKVTTGQHLGYTDNTGAPFESSGDHLHFGLVETDENWADLNANNGFNGCIDPMPFFTGVSNPTFTRDLFFGMVGHDVLELQRWLNAHLYTVIPSGQETTFYGPKTLLAVQRLQKAQGISPALGYFGPKTRAFVNNN